VLQKRGRKKYQKNRQQRGGPCQLKDAHSQELNSNGPLW
jgi:hypothetical protein